MDGLLRRVSGARMAATVAALAGDRLAGRRVGSTGGVAARTWLRRRLADLGAAVSVEVFPVRGVPEVYDAPRVRWHDGADTYELRVGRQVAVPVASADLPQRRRGGLGVAGAGDPGGRWLVVPVGMSVAEAYRHAEGAVGLLLSRGVDGDGWQYTMLAGPDPGPLPILTLDPATHDAARHAAGEAGYAWWQASTPIRRVDVDAANLCGRWPARADPAVEVLLTAHYDGVGDLPGLRQPGAADNASGVAVLLEAAQLLSSAPPQQLALSVALLDAEEVGALGSAHHATRLREAGGYPLVVNMDGAGRLAGAVAVEAGGPAHALLAILDQAGRHTGVPLSAGPVASDNRRYAAAGLPAVGLGAGMAGYHTPGDTPNRVEPDTMVALARLVLATTWLAATS